MGRHEVVVRVAAAAEQQIRAYPRVHEAFYRALTRSSAARSLVGRAKAGVRGGGAPAHETSHEEPALLRRRREAAVRARLGLPS